MSFFAVQGTGYVIKPLQGTGYVIQGTGYVTQGTGYVITGNWLRRKNGFRELVTLLWGTGYVAKTALGNWLRRNSNHFWNR
jgi:hypothetical protein